jgi:hypothetical protein
MRTKPHLRGAQYYFFSRLLLMYNFGNGFPVPGMVLQNGKAVVVEKHAAGSRLGGKPHLAIPLSLIFNKFNSPIILCEKRVQREQGKKEERNLFDNQSCFLS